MSAQKHPCDNLGQKRLDSPAAPCGPVTKSVPLHPGGLFAQDLPFPGAPNSFVTKCVCRCIDALGAADHSLMQLVMNVIQLCEHNKKLVNLRPGCSG